MKLAIMQPYFFPYLGYFQLIHATDNFIFYDDVNFIKGGWINRNRIISENGPVWINVLLEDPSSFKKICETKINSRLEWKSKLLKKLEYTYKKAPYFHNVFPIVQKVIDGNFDFVSQISIAGIIEFSNYLDLKTIFHVSSDLKICTEFSGAERVCKINLNFGATKYINLSGGMDLYSKDDFKNYGIDLLFLKSDFRSYKQFNDTFESGLSMIDLLMFNSKEEMINTHLKSYTLL